RILRATGAGQRVAERAARLGARGQQGRQFFEAIDGEHGPAGFERRRTRGWGGRAGAGRAVVGPGAPHTRPRPGRNAPPAAAAARRRAPPDRPTFEACRCSSCAGWNQATNPIFSCVPSQKGLLPEWPQRHNHVSSRALARPSAPSTVNGPLHSSGPLGIGVIVTVPTFDVARTASAGSVPGWRKPIFLCVPSQNGLLLDAPHRHRNAWLSRRVPSGVAMTTTKSPWKTLGTSGRTLSTVGVAGAAGLWRDPLL